LAVFKLASILAQGTGKLGQNVVTKGHDGYVGMRERVVPANPRSPKQVKVRGAQTESSQAWDSLTPLQCAAWRALASSMPQVSNKTGLPIKKQGFNVFCSNYDRFRLANPSGTFPVDPPTTRFVEENMGFDLDTDPGIIRVMASRPNATGHTYRTEQYYAFATGSLTLTLNLPAGHYAIATRIVSSVDGRAGRLKPLGVASVALSVVQGGADERPASRKRAA
jgi:hypothetical protein